MELTSLSDAFGIGYELARGHIGVRHTERRCDGHVVPSLSPSHSLSIL